LICLIIPGNTLPVIENPNDDAVSLKGEHIVGGYQSHYVIVNRKGYPLTSEDYENNEVQYDEIVIAQESQVVPIFLLSVNQSSVNML